MHVKRSCSEMQFAVLHVEVQTAFVLDEKWKLEFPSIHKFVSYEKPFILSHEACDELLQFH